MSSSKCRPPASAGITCCRWSRNCSRERMQQPKRLDGEQLIPADTRNTCVGAWHDYCHTGKLWTSEGARWLAKQIGGRLPPGWGAVWMERGCSKLEGTLAEQLQQVVDYLPSMETRCVRCQVRQTGTCRQRHLGWCTLCQQEKGECDVCSAPIWPRAR